MGNATLAVTHSRDSGQRVIELPEHLCAAAESRFAGQFATLTELLTFVLSELLCDRAEKLDKAEQQVVEERLRDLGYI